MTDDLLFRHTDYREYLRRALEARGLSQRKLAQALGRGEPWVSLMLSHQRDLSPDLVDPLARFLDLDARGHAYLAALVDLHNGSPRARRVAWATVQADQQHLQAGALSEDVAAALSSWVVGAVLNLAGCEGFRPEAAWIASTLRPPVSEAEAQAALTTLIRLELLAPDADGHLAASEPSWSPSHLPEGALSHASYEVQRTMLPLAVEALERFRSEERHMSTSTFALSEAGYARVLTRLRELEREVLLLAEADAEPGERVYQLGIQLFPLSDRTGHST
jgi:uncharacterized protein (TIGR02147 family)